VAVEEMFSQELPWLRNRDILIAQRKQYRCHWKPLPNNVWTQLRRQVRAVVRSRFCEMVRVLELQTLIYKCTWFERQMALRRVDESLVCSDKT
jgi:hypothetical protein